MLRAIWQYVDSWNGMAFFHWRLRLVQGFFLGLKSTSVFLVPLVVQTFAKNTCHAKFDRLVKCLAAAMHVNLRTSILATLKWQDNTDKLSVNLRKICTWFFFLYSFYLMLTTRASSTFFFFKCLPFLLCHIPFVPSLHQPSVQPFSTPGPKLEPSGTGVFNQGSVAPWWSATALQGVRDMSLCWSVHHWIFLFV